MWFYSVVVLVLFMIIGVALVACAHVFSQANTSAVVPGFVVRCPMSRVSSTSAFGEMHAAQHMHVCVCADHRQLCSRRQ